MQRAKCGRKTWVSMPCLSLASLPAPLCVHYSGSPPNVVIKDLMQPPLGGWVRDVYVYLKICFYWFEKRSNRDKGRERERGRDLSFTGFSPNSLSGQTQVEIPSDSPMCWQVSKSPSAFLGSWIGNRATGTQTHNLMWDTSVVSGLLCFTVMPALRKLCLVTSLAPGESSQLPAPLLSSEVMGRTEAAKPLAVCPCLLIVTH